MAHVCDACLDTATECPECGGTLNGPVYMSAAGARGAHRAHERANQYGLDHDWPPPYEGATRAAARELVASLGRCSEVTLERRARACWEGAKRQWQMLREQRDEARKPGRTLEEEIADLPL